MSLSRSESGPSGIPLLREKSGTPVAEEKPPDDTHPALANLRELALHGLSGFPEAQTKVFRRDTKIFGIVEPGIVNTESETAWSVHRSTSNGKMAYLATTGRSIFSSAIAAPRSAKCFSRRCRTTRRPQFFTNE